VIVDAHHHLWRLDHGYPWMDQPALAPIRRDFGVADLRAALAGTGVRLTVLVEAGRCDAAEVAEFLAIADETAEIAGVVGWVDLTDHDLAGTLAGQLAGPGGRWLVGTRAQVQGEPDPGYLGRPDVHGGLSTVATAGLAYDLVVRVDQLGGAVTAARAVPELTFVLDHLGKPAIRAGAEGLRRWREAITPLAAEPNVLAKLSGLVTEADWTQWTVEDLRPYVATAVELFGPGRLMVGSDWPVCLLAARYPDVLTALDTALAATGLSPAELAEIHAGTAIRAYRLDPTGA